MTLLDLERDPVPVVPGFRFAALAAGIKKNGRPDLGLIAADEPVACAAVFTKNRVQAAPVLVARERARRGHARAVLVNAGNANACTGAPGLRAARETTAAVAAALGCDVAHVLPASTGVIGAQLPVRKVLAGVGPLVSTLDPGGAAALARAIMTTDRWPKVALAQLRLGGKKTATVLGIAKGAGMIHPDMATTLAFVVTDAGASPALLGKLLREATDQTFNAISVDGDTSTNDTIVLLASGRAGTVRPGTPGARALATAVTTVLRDLGESIVRDGEGARHVAHIEVTGLRTDADARRIASAIATSPLVKTAMHGRDPNWGRILAAAGRAGVAFDPARAEIRIGVSTVIKKGLPVGAEAERVAAATMQGASYPIRVRLGSGRGSARYTTCDLGADYVAVNADYRS